MVHSGYLKDQYDYIRWAVELNADVIQHAYALPVPKGYSLLPSIRRRWYGGSCRGIKV